MNKINVCFFCKLDNSLNCESFCKNWLHMQPPWKFKDMCWNSFWRETFYQISFTWANDNQTFFYTTKNEVTLLSEHIDRHKLGTSQSKDVRVYTEKDNSFYIGVYRSKSDKYIIIYNSSTLSSDYRVINADNPEGEFHSFSPREKKHEYSIEHYKDKFYIITNFPDIIMN